MSKKKAKPFSRSHLMRMLLIMAKEAGLKEGMKLLPMAQHFKVDLSTNNDCWLWLHAMWMDRQARGIDPMSGRTYTKKQAPDLALTEKDVAPTGETVPSVFFGTTGRVPDVIFFSSEVWRTLRYETLRKAGGECALCGRSKRAHGVIMHVDHIKPRSKRPDLALEPTNLQALCEDCNLGKSNRDDTDWRA